MSSSSRYNTLVYKGSHHHTLKKEGWHYPWLGDVKLAKKIARRAQRRDNHKEIEAQLVEVEAIFIGKKKYWPTVENIFAPLPVFLMTEWERSGMEYYRTHCVQSNRGRGIRHWKHPRKIYRTDETLFETLQRSVNRS